jgi:hypothetical protein
MAAGSQVMTFPGVAIAAHAGGGGSVAGRIALVAIAVAVVGAFTVLQLRARSGRRRPPDMPDGQTPSPGDRYEPEDGDEALFVSHGPFCGFWSVPGYRGAPQLPWTARQSGGTQPPI